MATALDTKTHPLAKHVLWQQVGISRIYYCRPFNKLLCQNCLAYLAFGTNSERLVGMLVVEFAS